MPWVCCASGNVWFQCPTTRFVSKVLSGGVTIVISQSHIMISVKSANSIVWSEWMTSGTIDRTPRIPGSNKNVKSWISKVKVKSHPGPFGNLERPSVSTNHTRCPHQTLKNWNKKLNWFYNLFTGTAKIFVNTSVIGISSGGKMPSLLNLIHFWKAQMQPCPQT